MVQAKQSRDARSNKRSSEVYSKNVLPGCNSGSVVTIDRGSNKQQEYIQPPKRERKDSLWKGGTHDGIKTRVSQDPPPSTETMEGGFKLHLGCGGQNWDGFVDVDAYPAFDVKPDLVCCITELPYKENTVDEIWVIHVFEHLYLWEADDAVAHWHKMLKPGGKLVIEVPCMDKIIHNYQTKETDPRLTILGIFGEQLEGQPEMVHKWCYTKNGLRRMFEERGFEATVKSPVYHLKQRDMRVEGIKK